MGLRAKSIPSQPRQGVGTTTDKKVDKADTWRPSCVDCHPSVNTIVEVAMTEPLKHRVRVWNKREKMQDTHVSYEGMRLRRRWRGTWSGLNYVGCPRGDSDGRDEKDWGVSRDG